LLDGKSLAEVAYDTSSVHAELYADCVPAEEQVHPLIMGVSRNPDLRIKHMPHGATNRISVRDANRWATLRLMMIGYQ
jgi:hypothetical protein